MLLKSKVQGVLITIVDEFMSVIFSSGKLYNEKPRRFLKNTAFVQ